MRTVAVLPLLLASTVVAQSVDATVGHTDLDEAIAAARAAEKDILVMGHCGVRLQQVQAHLMDEATRQALAPHFVLLTLHIPMFQKAPRWRLQKPRGYSAMLMTLDGVVYGRTDRFFGLSGKDYNALFDAKSPSDQTRAIAGRFRGEIEKLRVEGKRNFDAALRAHREADWYSDYDEALAAAARSDKRILVVFDLGSNYSAKLRETLFDYENRRRFDEHYVFAYNDRHLGAKLPAKWQQLRSKHKVKGFSILVMNADGQVLGGRRGHGVASNDLNPIVNHQRISAERRRKIAAGFGKRIDELRERIQERLATQIPALKKRLLAGNVDGAIAAIARKLDPKNSHGAIDCLAKGLMLDVRDVQSAAAFCDVLDEVIALGAKDAELFESMLAQAARWSDRQLDDSARAKKYATHLKEKAKDPSLHAQLFREILGDDK